MIEKIITKTLVGRPFFWMELPKDAIFTKLIYTPSNYVLKLFYITDNENDQCKYEFQLYNHPRDSDNFAGHFIHGDLNWYIYYTRKE